MLRVIWTPYGPTDAAPRAAARQRTTVACARNQVRFSLATIHKVLRRHNASRLAERRWRRRITQRHSRPIPGDRVQMDVCKIAPGLYHYVAVDDCTRYRVPGLFSRRSATHTIAFLERVVEEMPFHIHRVQTDRGREFFALSVQPWLCTPRSNSGRFVLPHPTSMAQSSAPTKLTWPSSTRPQTSTRPT